MWESREETESVFYKFLSKGIGLNCSDVKLTDLHRLSQQPFFKGTVKIDLPIIFKVTNAFDKHAIMSRLKNLKSYDKPVKNDDPAAPYVYISECLPKELYKQKKQLLPKFKEVQKEHKHAKWSVINGAYCSIVDDKKFFAYHSITP